MTSLHLGDKAPDFTAETTEGLISFHDWKRDSWAILFSHPADYTPVCTTELGRVAQLQDEWARRDTKIIALSVDSVEDHNAWKPDIEEVAKVKVTYPIIADPDKKVAELYDMIHPGEGDTSSVRSVFVIGPDNLIKLMLVYPKSAGRNFDEVLRVLDALQLTESGPFATPADWRPGDKAIVSLALETAEAKERFPDLEVVKPYLRYTQPAR
ncbi:MAG TPA: peroxiredoxin [Dermatophilaceae bacterium]|nr:peroxiredoxin [Dermatophilaceae bacterium]